MYPEILTLGPYSVASFSIGPITLYTFGAMMGLGFLVASNLIARELGRHGDDPQIGSSILLAAAVGGIVGARAWAIMNEWQLFVADPASALFSGAGFVWYGGLVGGTLSVTFVFRRHGIAWLRGADCVAPGLVLGQAIGRIGCHLAGDGDWGSVTQVPWGVAYSNAIIGWPHPPGVLVHPTPLYEFAAYTAIFGFLWMWRKRARIDGEMFALYLMMAPAARFVIEFFRINPRVFYGLTQAQLFSVALIASGGILMFVLRRREVVGAGRRPVTVEP